MTTPTRPPSNAFVRTMRKAYNPIGFSKGYNAALWFIFGGALMGFTLARFQYLNIDGIFCGTEGASHAAPGECYNYQSGHERVGIIMHLATILPAAFLVVFQFVPFIRHKALLFHRINGYVCVVLALLSTVGVLMIARNAYGGEISTQLGVGFISIAFVAALVMAYLNIKRLQIEQHRAWMLRAWFYVSSYPPKRKNGPPTHAVHFTAVPTHTCPYQQDIIARNEKLTVTFIRASRPGPSSPCASSWPSAPSSSPSLAATTKRAPAHNCTASTATKLPRWQPTPTARRTFQGKTSKNGSPSRATSTATRRARRLPSVPTLARLYGLPSLSMLLALRFMFVSILFFLIFPIEILPGY